jgi:predicted GNAT family N-acyltransferase
LEVRLARTPDELEQALELRERVFAGEQGVPPERFIEEGIEHVAMEKRLA